MWEVELPCRITDDSKFMVKHISVGCFTTIHENVLIYGDAPVTIGRCCWIGRNVVLNATDHPLTIGDGVGIGANAGIYTHFKGGNVLLGTKFNRSKPVTIGYEAWIGCGAIVEYDVNAGYLVFPNTVHSAKNQQGMDHLPHVESLDCPTPRQRMELVMLKTLPVIDPKEKCLIRLVDKVILTENMEAEEVGRWEHDGYSVFNCVDLTFTFNGSQAEEKFMWELLKNQMKFYPRYN